MHLVHIHLSNPHQTLPAETATRVMACAQPEGKVEHVSVHAAATDRPTLGLFVTARTPEQAEDIALAAVREVLNHSELRGVRLNSWSRGTP